MNKYSVVFYERDYTDIVHVLPTPDSDAESVSIFCQEEDERWEYFEHMPALVVEDE